MRPDTPWIVFVAAPIRETIEIPAKVIGNDEDGVAGYKRWQRRLDTSAGMSIGGFSLKCLGES
jgi:hypothetical protein